MIINQVTSKEEAEKAIISVGQELIRRAKDICNDIDRVTSISIEAEIIPFPDEAINMNVTKNYVAEFKEEEKNNDNWFFYRKRSEIWLYMW